MSFRRLEISLAVPEPLSPSLEGQWNGLLNHIKAFKKSSVKINEGKANEENTTKATWHVCRHDTHERCEMIEI